MKALVETIAVKYNNLVTYSEEVNRMVNKNSILTGLHGSIAHNLYMPPQEDNGTDDIDIISVVIEEKDFYFSVFMNRIDEIGGQLFVDEWDIVCHEACKFINMLCSCNPNVLTLLWLRPEYYLNITNWGMELINNRNWFLTKDAVYNAFTGYARGQIHRLEKMVTHKANLGEKRRQLVEKYGYDTKYASHGIRLIKMAAEMLDTGKLIVYRESDKDELLSIKNGAYTLDQIKEYAAQLLHQTDMAYEKSSLSEILPYQKIQEFTSEMIFDILTKREQYAR